jgi:thioredoxin reductase
MKTGSIDVAIIGAGPYALSIAAHLKARGMDFRTFGIPMHFWRAHMPTGMRLKSEGFASSLYDPDGTFTLEAYCREQGLPYADMAFPIPAETFIAYGYEFQRRFVPALENKHVVSLRQTDVGYQADLEDGEVVSARKVIVAVGLSYYEHVPPVLSRLPIALASHSSRYGAVDHFKGHEVVVVGAGASAIDLAALLHRAGARVEVVARVATIRFFEPPQPHPSTVFGHLRNPVSGLGRGWKLFLCAKAPLVFRQMPEQFRLDKVRRVLGPAPSWFITPEVVGKVPLHLGYSIRSAQIQNDGVRLELVDTGGSIRTMETEHIIAATGYQVDLRRLSFLEACDVARIRSIEHTPVLSSNFESSLRGLYFVGASAASTFGPLLRFAIGARFTARRLARHLSKSAVH